LLLSRYTDDIQRSIFTAMTIKMYAYTGCGTCRNAQKWLLSQGLTPTILPIRETPPSRDELRQALKAIGSVRKLFNTSGGDYKTMGMKDRLPTLSDEEAIELLATHGNLVKRPFVLHSSGILVGFDATAWENALRNDGTATNQ
jgi:arsenate reductase (glutaredoxin)